MSAVTERTPLLSSTSSLSASSISVPGPSPPPDYQLFSSSEERLNHKQTIQIGKSKNGNHILLTETSKNLEEMFPRKHYYQIYNMYYIIICTILYILFSE